jgi:hypothetical protein
MTCYRITIILKNSEVLTGIRPHFSDRKHAYTHFFYRAVSALGDDNIRCMTIKRIGINRPETIEGLKRWRATRRFLSKIKYQQMKVDYLNYLLMLDSEKLYDGLFL